MPKEVTVPTLQFFWGNDPKPETPTIYTEFRKLYPVMGDRNLERYEVNHPVVSAVTDSTREGRLYGVFLPDGSHVEVDVTQYKGDEEIEFMALEEAILRLISEGRILPDTWIRIH